MHGFNQGLATIDLSINARSRYTSTARTLAKWNGISPSSINSNLTSGKTPSHLRLYLPFTWMTSDYSRTGNYNFVMLYADDSLLLYQSVCELSRILISLLARIILAGHGY
jgi:hypothetical protein